MKKIYTLFISVLLFLTAAAQTTRVQFINNSPDSLMKYVKIFVDGSLQKDSLAYRNGTPFYTLTGDVAHSILFRSVVDSTKSVSVTSTLVSGSKYVFVLNGLTNDTVYQKNPDS